MSTIIDLGKIRFQFRGDYSTTAQYEYNDVVKYGGDVYVYINATAGVGTAPTTTTHWSSMVSGLKAWELGHQARHIKQTTLSPMVAIPTGNYCHNEPRTSKRYLLGASCWRLRLPGQLGRSDCLQEG